MRWRSGFAGCLVLALAIGQLDAQTRQGADQQQGSPSTTQRSTLESSPHSQNQSSRLDSALAKWLIAMNEAEIQLSQLGQQKSQNPQVKDFASKMVQDHNQFVQQLRQVAGQSHSDSGSQSTSAVHSDQSSSRATDSTRSSGQSTSGSGQSTSGSGQSTSGSGQSASGSGQSASGSQREQSQSATQDPSSSSLGQSSSSSQGQATQDRTSSSQSGLSQSGQTGQNQSSTSSLDQSAQDRSSSTQTQSSDAQSLESDVETRAFRGDTSISSQSSSGELQQLLNLHRQIESKVTQTLSKGLQEKQGNQFDQTFVGLQLLAHMRMLDTLEVMQQHTSGQLRQAIEDARQTTQHHLQMAEELNKSLETSVASERTPQRQ